MSDQSSQKEGASFDVIVVGGGFAGVTATRDLSDAGLNVLLLEGRDRLGGRTYYRPFAETDQGVDLGGRWISPEVQPNLAREIERYAIPLAVAGAPQNYRWSLGGELRTTAMPIPDEQFMDLERALFHVIEAARRIEFNAPLDQAAVTDLDISFAAFVAPLDLPRATEDLLYSFIGFFLGTSPEDLSALQALAWIAGFRNSAWAWWSMMAHTFEHGTKSLIDAMIEDSGADVRLNSAVSVIEQDGDGVSVTLRSGDVFSGAAAIVTAPIHVWDDIEFRPELSKAKREIAKAGHAGYSINCWALVENAPKDLIAVGYGTGLNWLSTEGKVDDADLMVSLGHSRAAVDTSSRQDIERAVREFAPEANVVATDTHDWNTDEFSKGTWVAYRPGQVMEFLSPIQAPEGRILFAGSDIATGWVGWMDGAIQSGGQAAGLARELTVNGSEDGR